MITHKNLYLGDNIKSPDKYLKKLNSGKFINKFFVAVLNEDKKLEIYNSYIFLQSYYRNKSFVLVGISTNRDTLFEYVRRLSEISMRKYNSIEVSRCIDELDEFDIDFLYDDIAEESDE